jgi:hypothetical protein
MKNKNDEIIEIENKQRYQKLTTPYELYKKWYTGKYETPEEKEIIKNFKREVRYKNKIKSKKDNTVCTTLNIYDLTKLEKIAIQYKQSISSTVRMLITQGIERHKRYLNI